MRASTLILLIGLFASCQESRKKEHVKIETRIVEDIVNTDSIEQSFLEGRIFRGNIIALNDSMKSFFYVDTTFVDGLKYWISPKERIEYYRKVRSNVPKKLLSIHNSIWALPELKNMAEGDGGYGTRFTIWRGHYNDTITSFEIELKQDYFDRWGATQPFYSMTFNTSTGEISVVDMFTWPDGSSESISVWREERSRKQPLKKIGH